MRALFRLTVFLCVLALCCPLGATAAARADKDKVEEDFEALRRFSQVLDLVNRYYVKDVNQGELLDGALKGMLQGLDPHSTFMTPEEHKEMQETTSGEFTGIGIEITVENGQVTVVTPIEDTPAYRAGLQSGDIILTINGQPVLSRGKDGSFGVLLSLEPAGRGLAHPRPQGHGSGAGHPAQHLQVAQDRPGQA